MSEETAQRIARRRCTDKAEDGIAAFLEKNARLPGSPKRLQTQPRGDEIQV